MTPKEFRILHHMNQTELGELLGVTWGAVNHWELGARKVPKTIQRLIALFVRRPELMKEF